MRCFALVALGLAACSQAGTSTPTLPLRPACGDGQLWDGTSCRPTTEATKHLTDGTAALARQDVDEAKVALDKVEAAGPLDHETNVTLWEQRGIAAAYVDDEATARAAFDMLLALDPGHFLSYTLAPQVTFVFEKVRNATRKTGAPAVDVNWPSGQKVGDPVPLGVEVVADPKQFLKRATLFVRTRGDTRWRAADLALGLGREARVVIPAVTATKPTSLELYLRAYDASGNEVLAWADPTRPREIPLRYDPPPKWYVNWKTYAIAGPIAVGLAIVIAYVVTRDPPDEIGGGAVVK
jgi:hypothetical protein